MKHILTSILLAVALLFQVSAQAQNKTVRLTGTVYDENGDAMEGAAVMLDKGTSGTLTDNNGRYTIQVPSNGVVSFSMIGYKVQSIPVQGKLSLDVYMQLDGTFLDESVVVGYGTMKKSDITGSVSSLSSKAIENFKTSSVSEALGGQIAGVNIVSTDGTPGAGYDIKIRGVGSINGDSTPLFIVDGFEVSNIDYLANQDIQSIEVLKDASASAIYGSRAANGVIIVTTRTGKEGRPEISYNGSGSYRTLSKHLDVMNPYEFVKLQLDLNPIRYATTYFRSGKDKDGVDFKYQSLDDYIGVDGIDWQSESFRPTWSQSHDVSIMGGNSSSKYNISFSHFDEDGLFESNTYAKNNIRFRFMQKVNKWLSFDANLTYVSQKTTGIGTGGSTLSNILMYRPVGNLGVSDYELRYNASDPLLEELGLSNTSYYNPIVNAASIDNNKKTDQWIANGSLTVTITRHLSFKSSASYNMSFTRSGVFYKDGSMAADRGTGPYGNSQMTRALYWNNSNVLTYTNKFGGEHSVNFTLGHETGGSTSEYLKGEARDFPMDDLGVNNLSLGTTPSEVATSLTTKSRLSFFARGFYSFKERHMLTATVRADASSVFSANNKWGVFPSLAYAWNMANEPFMDFTKNWLSVCKLRLGWGTVGNSSLTNYLSLNLYNNSKYGIGDKQVTVLQPAQLPNDNLRWEGATTTNIGLDMGMWNGRLNITADAFVKDSKDLLMAQTLALNTGFSSQWQNIGKIRNKGIELTVNTINVNRRHFSWRTDFNISFIRNTLLALDSGSDYLLSKSSFNGTYTSYDYIAEIGKPLGNMYGYEFDGVYQTSDFYTTGEGVMVLRPGVTDITDHFGETVKPGFVKYKDQDGDGVITTEDRTIIGNGQPDFYGGLSNTFIFGGLDFSFMFQYSVGNDVYNAQRMYLTQSRLEMMNYFAEENDRWTSVNASNSVPSAAGYVTGDVYSRFIEDGSFLRLKNVTLGYTLPSSLTRKVNMNSIRFYATAQNLFCLTRYSGYDPEVNMKNSNLMPALDYGAYPKSNVYTFGIEVKF